jgi:hypothetical protein
MNERTTCALITIAALTGEVSGVHLYDLRPLAGRPQLTSWVARASAEMSIGAMDAPDSSPSLTNGTPANPRMMSTFPEEPDSGRRARPPALLLSTHNR